MAKVKPSPQGSHSITPGLVIKDASRAIEFYKTAFGATVLDTMDWPDGRGVMHAELKIGDSKFYVGEEVPEMGAVSPQTLGGTPVSINLYVEDCDAVFKRATTAGARVEQPLTDMFWGDRYGKLTDPFGHKWGIATHKEDVSKPEIEKRAREWLSQAARK
jgi:PhnB protein